MGVGRELGGKAAHRAGGWSAEIRIPIRVLRFDGSLPVQSWGLQAARFIAERQETNLWAYFPRDVATPIAYLGRLDDLRGLKGGGALELMPFGVGYARRQRRDRGRHAGQRVQAGGLGGPRTSSGTSPTTSRWTPRSIPTSRRSRRTR